MASLTNNVDTAASVEDVERILDQLLSHEAALDARLVTLLDPSNQPFLNPLASFRSLHIGEQISRLNERVGPAAETAHSLSERVRKLDIEQSRVKESLKYVEDVQELKVFLFCRGR